MLIFLSGSVIAGNNLQKSIPQGAYSASLAYISVLDLGLTNLLIRSDGVKSGNPKHIKRYEQKLACLQRNLTKKRKGSNNKAKARLKVIRPYEKIADCRMDTTPQ